MRADDVDLARDRALVEAWQAGDTSAFDDLYRRYFDRLRAFCRRRIDDPAEADDIAQEAFLRALQALPRLSGERRFYPWVTVIAGRLCIDHHRRRGRVEPSDDVDPGSVDDGHDARLDLQADLDHLDQALRRLGPRHLEVLQLREREELTYDQIAGRLGVPHSTVEALLFRARKALRREFHLVSADRLAALPLVGWVLGRAGRLRDRLAVAPDVGSIGGALAAGAMTAVLVALPGPAAPPQAVRSVPLSAPAAASDAMPPTPPAAAPGGSQVDGTPADLAGGGAPTRTPPIRPMTPEEAAEEAAGMPVGLDLDHLGLGLDPAPLVDRLVTPLRRHP